MSDDRLIEMEIKLSELEQMVVELNDVVTKQWAQVDRISIENKHLRQKISRLEHGLKPSDDVPPPHY